MDFAHRMREGRLGNCNGGLSLEVSRCRAHAPRALARRGPPLQCRSSTFQNSYGFLAAALFSSARAPDSVFAKP